MNYNLIQIKVFILVFDSFVFFGVANVIIVSIMLQSCLPC